MRPVLFSGQGSLPLDGKLSAGAISCNLQAYGSTMIEVCNNILHSPGFCRLPALFLLVGMFLDCASRQWAVSLRSGSTSHTR